MSVRFISVLVHCWLLVACAVLGLPLPLFPRSISPYLCPSRFKCSAFCFFSPAPIRGTARIENCVIRYVCMGSLWFASAFVLFISVRRGCGWAARGADSSAFAADACEWIKVERNKLRLRADYGRRTSKCMTHARQYTLCATGKIKSRSKK